MSNNPLDVKRSGDLSALGISDRNPMSEEIPQDQEMEAQATAAEEVEVPAVEPEEVRAQETEQAEDEKPESILSQLGEEEAAPKQDDDIRAQLERERQQRMAAEAALMERRRIAEEAVRDAAKAPKQEEQEPESYLKSPYVQQTLRAIREENPDQYEQTLVEIAKAEFGQTVAAREAALREELNQIRQENEQSRQYASAEQGIKSAFGKIKAEGGLGAELVDELYSKGYDDSHLGRLMAQEPERFATERGTEEAIRVLESRLYAKIRQAQQREKSAAVQGTVVSAGTGVASNRGAKLHEKPKEVSPEDEYTDRIFNSRRAAKIEFLG